MNVSLTPELERFVQEKVKSGRYLSASEVMREALRLMEERDKIREWRLAKLQAEINAGIGKLAEKKCWMVRQFSRTQSSNSSLSPTLEILNNYV
ncbi:MAG TPA: type II toxin-antitoxin system ParD family antitoxin [Cyanobacteria bacterium UBA8803]|nr:type II toxin-antitoxin system ParD family antitoxin [Cyanobacteria bacterium UBA9273]HBL59716.1 type II toxin-antitoxin system ParD family antitoxin [Cyanobacteria bacterium UBA8803]